MAETEPAGQTYQTWMLGELDGVAAALTALSTSAARADQWCGYTAHDDAVIECGYTTAAQCETAVGKGGMCFVDPDVALNSKRHKAMRPATLVTGRS